MNKHLATVSVGLLLSASAFAQELAEKAIPAAVKTAFSQKYPTAKKVNWDLKSVTEWEAEFKQGEKEYAANFSVNGTWQETEQDLEKADLPGAITQTLTKDFDGFKIEEAEISQNFEGSVYEVMVVKSAEDWELVVDANGKLIEKNAI